MSRSLPFVDFLIVPQRTLLHQGPKWRNQLSPEIDNGAYFFVVLPLLANMLEQFDRCTGKDDIASCTIVLSVTVLIIYIELVIVFGADAEFAHFTRETGPIRIDNDVL